MSRSAPDFSHFARPAVRAQTLYSIGAPPDADVKINQNEAPHDLPEAMKQEVFERLMQTEWHKYPSIDAMELRTRLSDLWGWPAEGIVIGNGSNHLLSVVPELRGFPIRDYYNYGISTSLNTDDKHIFDVDLVDEYEAMAFHNDFTLQELQNMNLRALKFYLMQQKFFQILK